MTTRLSVALCTCNGERYLGEQLASLERQTRAPDELVVCDDLSNDGTRGVLEAFRSRALFPVRVVGNDARLGPATNFEKAIGLCTGDLIALCDQDDVWLPGKLATAEARLAADPHAGLVFSDATLVDEELRPIGSRLWETLRFTAEEQRRVSAGDAVPVLLRHQVVTGATMTFRSRARGLVLPIASGWIQDGWIALLVAATGRLAVIPEPLVLYRQHAANQIGARKMGLVALIRHARRPGAGQGLATDIARFRAVRERLRQPGVAIRDARTLALLDALLAHLEVRTELARTRVRRLWPVLREAASGRYFSYSNGALSIVQDLLL